MNDYKRYLEKEYKPAQKWVKSNLGKKWIADNVPTMHEYINMNYDVVDCGIYSIHFNNKCIYIGQSPKTCNRLVVHFHHMWEDSFDFFGIKDTNEIKACISISILEKGLFDDTERLIREKVLIREHKPALQKHWLATDECESCVNRGIARRNEIEKLIE